MLDGFAYLPRSALGVQVVDVRHPDAPSLVGVLDTPSQALQITTANDLIYVVDSVFGLQVIQGSGADLSDLDGEGVIDFFDRFPLDATEFQDSDGDGVGDTADADDDNDGFSDAVEQGGIPQTDPLDPLSFPVTPPPEGLTTLVVDASSTQPAQGRNGTPEAPYRSLNEAMQVIRGGQAPLVTTLAVRAGTYAALTTGERFPIDFSGLSNLTLQGAGRDTTILDANFVDDVITADGAVTWSFRA